MMKLTDISTWGCRKIASVALIFAAPLVLFILISFMGEDKIVNPSKLAGVLMGASVSFTAILIVALTLLTSIAWATNMSEIGREKIKKLFNILAIVTLFGIAVIGLTLFYMLFGGNHYLSDGMLAYIVAANLSLWYVGVISVTMTAAYVLGMS